MSKQSLFNIPTLFGFGTPGSAKELNPTTKHGIHVKFQVVSSHEFLTHLTDTISGHDGGLPTTPAFSRVDDITICFLGRVMCFVLVTKQLSWCDKFLFANITDINNFVFFIASNSIVKAYRFLVSEQSACCSE